MSTCFEEVVDAFETDNAAWAAKAFSTLERELESHLRMEEEHLFPLLSPAHPEEIAGLVAEHAEIRAALAAAAVNVDLHAERASALRALVERLRAHATREDAMAYRWAEGALTPHANARLRATARERIASLAERTRHTWSNRLV